MRAIPEQRPALSAASVRVSYRQEAVDERMRHGHQTAPCAARRPIALRSASCESFTGRGP
eukprot:160453-Pyramimonas_sp.AAC.1